MAGSPSNQKGCVDGHDLLFKLPGAVGFVPVAVTYYVSRNKNEVT